MLPTCNCTRRHKKRRNMSCGKSARAQARCQPFCNLFNLLEPCTGCAEWCSMRAHGPTSPLPQPLGKEPTSFGPRDGMCLYNSHISTSIYQCFEGCRKQVTHPERDGGGGVTCHPSPRLLQSRLYNTHNKLDVFLVTCGSKMRPLSNSTRNEQPRGPGAAAKAKHHSAMLQGTAVPATSGVCSSQASSCTPDNRAASEGDCQEWYGMCTVENL
jgi:hypothetical protein